MTSLNTDSTLGKGLFKTLLDLRTNDMMAYHLPVSALLINILSLHHAHLRDIYTKGNSTPNERNTFVVWRQSDSHPAVNAAWSRKVNPTVGIPSVCRGMKNDVARLRQDDPNATSSV